MASDSTPPEHECPYTPNRKLWELGIPSLPPGCPELKTQKVQHGVMFRMLDWVPVCVNSNPYSTYLLNLALQIALYLCASVSSPDQWESQWQFPQRAVVRIR